MDIKEALLNLWYRLPFTRRKTFVDYVSPLQKMVTKLEKYITWRDKHIAKQEKMMELIKMDIRLSHNEIMSSQDTIDNISKIYSFRSDDPDLLNEEENDE